MFVKILMSVIPLDISQYPNVCHLLVIRQILDISVSLQSILFSSHICRFWFPRQNSHSVLVPSPNLRYNVCRCWVSYESLNISVFLSNPNPRYHIHRFRFWFSYQNTRYITYLSNLNVRYHVRGFWLPYQNSVCPCLAICKKCFARLGPIIWQPCCSYFCPHSRELKQCPLARLPQYNLYAGKAVVGAFGTRPSSSLTYTLILELEYHKQHWSKSILSKTSPGIMPSANTMPFTYHENFTSRYWTAICILFTEHILFTETNNRMICVAAQMSMAAPNILPQADTIPLNQHAWL